MRISWSCDIWLWLVAGVMRTTSQKRTTHWQGRDERSHKLQEADHRFSKIPSLHERYFRMRSPYDVRDREKSKGSEMERGRERGTERERERATSSEKANKARTDTDTHTHAHKKTKTSLTSSSMHEPMPPLTIKLRKVTETALSLRHSSSTRGLFQCFRAKRSLLGCLLRSSFRVLRRPERP